MATPSPCPLPRAGEGESRVEAALGDDLGHQLTRPPRRQALARRDLGQRRAGDEPLEHPQRPDRHFLRRGALFAPHDPRPVASISHPRLHRVP